MGNREPRLTTQTIKVLGAFMSCTQEIGASGAEISRQTELASGTLYPILFRLEEAGWLESEWEEGDPSALGRPRRRLYQITGLGAKKTKAAFRELFIPVRGLAWL
jgi:DNA-binding PadR family transcriptional regulator